MSKTETDIAFLAQVVSYDDTVEGRRLKTGIAQAQQDERSIQRALRLPALLGLLAVIGLSYWQVFLSEPDFMVQQASTMAWSARRFIANGFWGLGVGSAISLLVLLGFVVVYRKRTGRWQVEGRRFAVRLLEARLGKPAVPQLPRVLTGQEIFLELLHRDAKTVPASNTTSLPDPLLDTCVSSEHVQFGIAGDMI